MTVCLLSSLTLVMAALSRSPAGSAPPADSKAALAADPKAALAAAMVDAGSDDPARHQALLKQLRTRAFLETLDSPADYAAAAKLRLHVGQVVAALAKNPAPSAQKAFLALTSDRVFLAHDERVIALILASVEVRPAPPALVRFWEKYSRRPDDGFAPTIVNALVDNGSAPAIGLLEKKMVDPAYSDDDKIGWMRSAILTHRNDLPLLQGCRRLLEGKLRKNLRPPLVEVLFDYRPQEWFRPASSHSAPKLESATPAARAELRKIADLALKRVALNPTQKAAVEARIVQIEALRDKEVR